jgi:hypothetical protein
MLIRLALVACILITAQRPVAAADLYISPTGDNAKSGSKDAPWKTLQHALNQLKPGDTAHAMAGTYVEKIVVGCSGS